MKTKMVDLMRKLNIHVAKPRPNSILYNRVVLYFIFFVALVNLYTLAVSEQYKFVAIFVLVSFLTSFFSKNMMVILVIAIVITNLLQVGLSVSGRLEGFSEGIEGAEGTEEDTANETVPSDVAETVHKATETPTATDKKSNSPEKKNETEIKKEIMKDGKELLTLQKNIVDGFEGIAPYMTQAEEVSNKIQKNADIINKMNEK